jgi:hypothetical protein
MIVRVDTEAVEGKQVDLLAGDVAEDVNGDATVPLARDAHLEAEPDVARFDHVGSPVVADRAALADRHLARLGLHLVQHGQELRGVDLQRDLLISRAAEHRRQLAAQLGHRPSKRVSGDRGIEHDADVGPRRVVVIVRMIVEALEAK